MGALVCFAVHLSVYFSPKSTKLTPYLASSAFLLLHGLMSIRLYMELDDGGDSGNAMMLPFKTGNNEEDEEEEEEEIVKEMTEISFV